MSASARLRRAIEGLSPAVAAYAVAVTEAGALGEEPLCEWLDGERRSGREVYDLSEQLPAAGLVGEFELTHLLGRHLGLPVVGEVELEMFASAHPALDRSLCADYGLVCLSDEPKSPLPVAVSNPLDEEVLAYVSSLVGEPLKVHLARLSDIAREVEACYGTEEEWAEGSRERGGGVADLSVALPVLPEEAERADALGAAERRGPLGAAQAEHLPLWRSPEEDGGSIEAFKRLLGGEG